MCHCIFSCFGFDFEIQHADLNGELWTIETDTPESPVGKNIQLQDIKVKESKVSAVYKEYSVRHGNQNSNELQHLIKQ